MKNSRRLLTLATAVAVVAACGMPAFAQDAAPGYAETEAEAAARAVAESARQAETAVNNRLYAPDPQTLAATSTPAQPATRLRLPSGEFQDITPEYTSPPVQTQGTGATIAVPANARAGTAYQAPSYNDQVYTDTTYIDETGLPVYVAAPGYSTVYEYETLIRAGRSPSYSITTLHGNRYPYYYDRPTSPYLYRYPSYRYPSVYSKGYYHRPYYSSGLGYTRYDPLGSSLHRSAQLRFHEASRPKLDVRPHDRHDSHRGHADRGHRGSGRDYGRDSGRDRSDRSAREGTRVREVRPMGGSPRREASPRSSGSSGSRDRSGSTGGGRVRRSPK